MDNGLRDERWGPIDDGILRGEVLATLKAIRAAAGVGLKEAMDIYHERYRKLRESRPDEFASDDRTYWEGFYS